MGRDATMAADGTDATVAMDGTPAIDMAHEPPAHVRFVVAGADFLIAEKLAGTSVYDSIDDRVGGVKDLLLSLDGVTTKGQTHAAFRANLGVKADDQCRE